MLNSNSPLSLILMPATLSVALISYNESHNLARTLDSVKAIANEIVLLDSGSSDSTVEIAKSYGAKVETLAWRGYVEQKNALFALCTKDFILNLDCDEVLSESLVQEIQAVLNDPAYQGYVIRRYTHYLGKLLKHSWQPDKKLRLVKRAAQPIWQGANVHEKLTIDGKTTVLTSPLIHYSYTSARQHFDKTVHYAELVADAAYQSGKPFRSYKLLINPAFAFLRMYVFRLGCLDGWRGFAAASSSAFYTFLKYWFLWERQL